MTFSGTTNYSVVRFTQLNCLVVRGKWLGKKARRGENATKYSNRFEKLPVFQKQPVYNNKAITTN
jgi:hypothetical protein